MREKLLRHCVAFIDDDEDLLAFLKHAVETQGIECHCYPSGDKALEEIEEVYPGIVFIDYRLVEGDGITLMKKIKELLPFSVLIMLTGEGNEMVAVQSIKSGAEDYLVKPVDNALLIEIMYNYFKKFLSAVLELNEKYIYPLNDNALARYEFLRCVYSGKVRSIREACCFFNFSRQDFYNYEKRFKLYGPLGLLKKKDFEKLLEPPKKVPKEKMVTFEDFLDMNDPVQQRIEMFREAATSPKPNICDISEKHSFTRESFYQIYQRFKVEGVMGLTEREKGRPTLKDA